MVEENTGTIDFGIDLGTTTSSIAKVDGSDTIVIPNRTDNKNFVASAVYIKKDGTIFIGDKAKNKIATDPRNGYAEFKLRMGSDQVYDFEASGRQMTPVELSAEILKNLRDTVKIAYEKNLQATVITVPADFTAPQTKATVYAAKLAGFKEVKLIQEPVAAAIAYGFGNSKDNETWLVYDLGGGTFDVSIVRKNSDTIDNINNQGDAYLGGKLIDWDIVDKIFVPAVINEFDLNDFDRKNHKYLKQFAKLKKAAEHAKIDLSNYDTAEVEIENFIIIDDEMFDFEFDVSRSQLEEVMKPYVDRTINHCKKALNDIDLSIVDITKIILVGGSTLSVYIHDRLIEEFNVPLEYSIDPTTVVARGAAIFAGTQSIVMEDAPDTGFVSVEVMYDKTGSDVEFEVNGKLINPDGSPEHFSLEFVNNKTGYSSGKIPVNVNGVFRVQLIAEDENDYNIYEIKVYDSSGNILNLSHNAVNTIKYKIDVKISKPILSHTIGLGKYGNELDVIAKKGTELPFEFKKTYKSSNIVRAGNSSDEVYVPLYQGNMMKADRNTLIGHLKITGDDIKRDLPADSNIELSVSIDDSTVINADVYIELLDQDFDEGMVIKAEKQSLDTLVNKFDKQKERYNDILVESAGVDNSQIQDFLNQIAAENMVENIRIFLKNSKTDPDALDNASKRINEFTNILDQISDILKSSLSWNKLKIDVDFLIYDIERNIDNVEPQLQNLYPQVKDMYDEAIETQNEQLLANVYDKLEFIFSQIHEEELLIDAFMELSSAKFVDQNAADRLIAQGHAALSAGNMMELRKVIESLLKISKPETLSERWQNNPPAENNDNIKDNRLK